MTRLTGDELRNGVVWTGFDDARQVWVVDGLGQARDEMPGAQRRSHAPDRGAPAVADPAAPPTEA